MEKINYKCIKINNKLISEKLKLPSFINAYILFYSLENNASIFINKKKIILKENCVLFINKNIIHSLETNQDSKIYEFDFASSLVSLPLNPVDISNEDIDEDIDYILLGPRNRNYISLLSTLDRLIELENDKNDFYDYDVLKCLYSIWAIINQNISNSVQNKKNKKYKMVRSIISYIESSYKSKLGLNEIIKTEESSLSTCYRAFKSITGISIHQYIKQYRLYKCMEGLLNSNKKANAIAIDNGFMGKNQFSYQFKKECKMSPIRFREKYSNPTSIWF
ncbi:MAG: AraC family transcriptional regulator [Candidatus Enteromonas sp.]|nr:AraC family transcriptional regulator [Candidatus Enteromonas sp.]